MCFYRLVALLVGGVWAGMLAGCSPPEEPQRYRAPKAEVSVPVADSSPRGSMVSADSGRVRLTYDVPEGWTRGQVGGMRKAAFAVQDGERKVEITAIDLSARAGELLPNVNRWREQIKLGKTTLSELDKTAPPIQVAGVEGRYVELMGPGEADQRQAILAVVVVHSGKAWFFKLWGDADLAQREKDRFRDFVKSVRFATPQPGRSPPAATGAGRLSLKCEVPEGWMPGKAGGMRRAAYAVENNGQKVEITVIDLPGQAGTLLPNVNLWRRQIKLGETTQAELDKLVSPIQVAGVEGHYVEILGPEQADPRQAVMGVVVNRGGRAWFFKMWGNVELALREKDQFQDFVKSAKFGNSDGAVNGD